MTWTVEVDQLLTKLITECIQNGWGLEDETVTNLRTLLDRTFSERTPADWAYVGDLSILYAFFVLNDGKRIYDYVEKAPKLIRIPLSELRPMEEFDDLLKSKGPN